MISIECIDNFLDRADKNNSYYTTHELAWMAFDIASKVEAILENLEGAVKDDFSASCIIDSCWMMIDPLYADESSSYFAMPEFTELRNKMREMSKKLGYSLPPTRMDYDTLYEGQWIIG